MSSEFHHELLRMDPYDLWRIHRTLFEMLKDRGLSTDYAPSTMNEADFAKHMAHVLSLRDEAHLRHLKKADKKAKKPKKSKRVRKTDDSDDDTDEDVGEEEEEEEEVDERGDEEEEEEKEEASEDGGDDNKPQESKDEKQSEKTETWLVGDPLRTYDPKMSSFEMCLTFGAVHPNGGGRLLVFFAATKQLGVGGLSQLAAYLDKIKYVKDVVLITADGFTAFAHGDYMKLRARYDVQPFLYADIMTNITHHRLNRLIVHTRIADAEKRAMMDEFSITDVRSLPQLKFKSCISKYYNFRVGDIIRIDRPGCRSSYRCVVD